jgi:hypothetical protein
MNTRTIAAPQLVANSISLSVVRISTALLMTFAAAVILVHAQVYSGAMPQSEMPTFDPASINTAYLR